MATFQGQLTADNLERISNFVAAKQPATVIRQTPAAGTPVIEGMTIEVQTVSLSDVPYEVLDPNALGVIRDVPIAQLDKAIAGDDMLKAAVATGNVVDPPVVAERFNNALAREGVTRTISANDAIEIVKSFNQTRFVGH